MSHSESPAPPSFQQHYYPDVNVSWRVARRPECTVKPGCCGRGTGSGVAGLVSVDPLQGPAAGDDRGVVVVDGAGDDVELEPDVLPKPGLVEVEEEMSNCITIGGGCDVVLHGWASCGVVFDLDGVHPLFQRMHRCRTHGRTFGVFDDECAVWLYQQPSPPGRGSMWDYVRPEPCVVQHARSYYSAGLLSHMIGMYERGIEQQRILSCIQQLWQAQHEQRASEYTFHGWPQQVLPWGAERGHKLMTDRRKFDCLLADYFSHFLEGGFQRDLRLACQYLCYGLTTDETFKVTKACSVMVEPEQPRSGTRRRAWLCTPFTAAQPRWWSAMPSCLTRQLRRGQSCSKLCSKCSMIVGVLWSLALSALTILWATRACW